MGSWGAFVGSRKMSMSDTNMARRHVVFKTDMVQLRLARAWQCAMSFSKPTCAICALCEHGNAPHRLKTDMAHLRLTRARQCAMSFSKPTCAGPCCFWKFIACGDAGKQRGLWDAEEGGNWVVAEKQPSAWWLTRATAANQKKTLKKKTPNKNALRLKPAGGSRP